MDHKLYKAAMTDDIDSLRALASSTVVEQLTTQQDNIFHVAANYNAKRVTEEIMRVTEEIMTLPPPVALVCQQNSKGDTALHIAARLGSLETAQVLINCAKSMSRDIEADERLIRKKNMEKDTALHDAARNGHFQIAELLITEDPVLAEYTNNVGESPLFIAVDKNHVKIAKLILEVAPVCSFKGRNNINALHAAVIRRSTEVFRLNFRRDELLRDKNPNAVTLRKLLEKYALILFFTVRPVASRLPLWDIDFVECMTNKCQTALSETDQYGWTPLHYAVHFGEISLLELFLKYIDSSTDYIRDKEGMSVTHIAAREGEEAILKMLASHFPEIWDLQDNNGQTALHLAVARGKLGSVKVILGNDLSHYGLINQQDNEGSTALHLAAMQTDLKIFDFLIKDSRVNKTAANKEGLTVIDILRLNTEFNYVEKISIAMIVASKGGLESLEHTINKNGRKANIIGAGKLEQPQQPEGREPASDTHVEAQRQVANRKAEPAGPKIISSDQLRNIASDNLVVTTLIATVSFAAGFAVPGGYKNDGPDEGMAILSRKTAFRVFMIANALAFCFSTTSICLHYIKSLMTKLDVLTLRTTLYTNVGAIAMALAFISGTYAILAGSSGLATAVLSIECFFFVFQYVIYLRHPNVKTM